MNLIFLTSLHMKLTTMKRNIFIAMSYKPNKYSIEDAHWSGKHDVYLSSDDIHIEDEDVLKELKD